MDITIIVLSQLFLNNHDYQLNQLIAQTYLVACLQVIFFNEPYDKNSDVKNSFV